MGLSSVLSTALTGLQAAETTIDVVGNNLANSQTVGFKASEAQFSTQFLQTLGLGSAPGSDTGGTNPRQIGLGTQVATITPDFSQGTVQLSSNPSDLAIQGEGFFILQADDSGERVYSRNGVFRTNSQNELISLTGQRVLGYGVNDRFEIESTTLKPMVIPLGSAAVAQATRNVYLEGNLSPTGELASIAQIISTGVLGDAQFTQPAAGTSILAAATPNVSTTTSGGTTGGSMGAGAYSYRIVYVDDTGTESPASSVIAATVGGANNAVQLSNLPPVSGDYSQVRIYRTEAGGSTYYRVGQAAAGAASFTDTIADASLTSQPQLNTDTLTGQYTYYVTYVNSAGIESRPQPVSGTITVNNGRIQVTDIPAANPADGWIATRLYRNVAADTSSFFRITELTPATTAHSYTDSIADAAIVSQPEIDFNGPTITGSTLLTNVLRYNGSTYEQMFPSDGTVTLTARKGGRTLEGKSMDVVSGANGTTVQDFLDFIEDAAGIRPVPGDDANHPIPADGGSTLNPGGYVTTDGEIQFISNNGEGNAVEIGLSGLEFTTSAGTTQVNLPFATSQEAVGESATTEFVAYDSLGIPLSVRLTMVLESRDSISTTFRWFADSPDNDPLSGAEIGVGTGLVSFDGEGNVLSVTNSTVSIERRNVPSVSPQEFELDFSQLSGLASANSTLAAARQDGSGPGTLSSYIIGEDGTIRGVFSNGASRDLGQIRLARFANASGLQQRGENLFSVGVNSGLPIEGTPGEQGIGTLVAGAVELSNTDVGKNLIDLILASTQYRGNSRVITTSQQMLDELLNIRR